MTAKKRKNPNNTKALKLAVIIIAAAVVIALGVTLIKTVVNKKRSDKTVRVAFYGLSGEYCDILKEQIPVEEGINLVYEILPEGIIDLGTVKDKYDLFFSWKGEVTEALEEASEDIPAKILEVIPSSLQNKKCVPVVLDNCELAYSKSVVEKTGGNMPSNFPLFLKYISDSRSYVFSPFFCNGADDRVFTAFIGNIIEAIGGVKAYKMFVDEIRKGSDFDTIMDLELTDGQLTLRKVLDSLKEWPDSGFTHPNWYSAYGNDLLYFAQEDHVAVFYTYLHEHRKIQYDVISKFEAFIMPPASSTVEYGVMAPAVSVMLFSDNSNAKRYVQELFTQEAQEELSTKTKLAPVHLRAQAYDKQADDVRYWVAACPGGALPDLYLAAFQRKPAEFKEFTSKIRNYIK